MSYNLGCQSKSGAVLGVVAAYLHSKGAKIGGTTSIYDSGNRVNSAIAGLLEQGGSFHLCGKSLYHSSTQAPVASNGAYPNGFYNLDISGELEGFIKSFEISSDGVWTLVDDKGQGNGYHARADKSQRAIIVNDIKVPLATLKEMVQALAA